MATASGTKVGSKAARRIIPRRTALEAGAVPISQLARIACREGQATIPLFRIHRWFARRLSSQFRAILSALSLPASRQQAFWTVYGETLDLRDAVVVDPFVGGGTSATEAVRANARFVGYDIDPVAAVITRAELGLGAVHDFDANALERVRPAAEAIKAFHESRDNEGRVVTVLHHFWVEVRPCRSCKKEFQLHPHFQLAHDRAKSQWVFCKDCNRIRQVPLSRKRFKCECGTWTRIFDGPVRDGSIACPHCDDSQPLASRRKSPPQWHLFAQEYLNSESGKRLFKRASDHDRRIARSASASLRAIEKEFGGFAPARCIPAEGRKDARPLIHGFSTYRQMFNDRQLLHLTHLGRTITSISDASLRHLLSIAYSEHLAANCMYTGYAFGYRRTSPLFSIHGYRHVTRPVEINPWLFGVGRGTYPNAVRKISRAIAYAKAPAAFVPKGIRLGVGKAIIVPTVSQSASEVIAGKARAAVIAESSTALSRLPSSTVDIVLTDPPYLDNIAYSELSDFYLAWHQRLGLAPAPFDDPAKPAPLADNMGLAQRDEESTARYRSDLTSIFTECRRVLRPSGVMAFTYHHDSALAWDAVAQALFDAGFACTGVLPLRGEGNGGLHSHSGSIKWDAVLVCRPRRSPGHGRELRVTVSDIAFAKESIANYWRRLAPQKAIRFGYPDAQNLFRAILGSRASARRSGTPLSDALAISWRDSRQSR